MTSWVVGPASLKWLPDLHVADSTTIRATPFLEPSSDISPKAGCLKILPGHPINYYNESQNNRKPFRKSVRRTKGKAKTNKAVMKVIQNKYDRFTSEKESFKEIRKSLFVYTLSTGPLCICI